MKSILKLAVTASLTAVLAACNTTPERIEALDNARTIVPQLEASPRAGVAASQISDARASLDLADRLERSGGQRVAIEHQATIAVLNAQIAQEKILTAEAKESLAKATEERQTVLISSREREADAANARTDGLEREVAIERAKK
jgi:OmpA-OmpF porin, OOP family